MKKYKNIEKIYGVIWAAIFLGLASWLKSIDWNAISWLSNFKASKDLIKLSLI